MKADEVYEKLLEDGAIDVARVERWRGLARQMAILESIGRSGLITLLKFDGERADDQVFTVMVSGEALGDKFFRQDGNDLCAILDEAVNFYASEVLGAE